MSILDGITDPAQVAALSESELERLADEVRRRIIDVVAHAGPVLHL